MIVFSCGNCGQKFRMPDARGGKKGRCPKCRGVILVPAAAAASEGPAAAETEGSGQSPYNLTFLDAPQQLAPAVESPDQSAVPDAASQDPDELLLGYRRAEPEPPPKRKLPWLIDIFLYPLNKQGLTILAIVVGIPLLLHLFTKFLALFTMVFPPMLVFLVLLLIIRLLLGFVFVFYVAWYICECIRDSALGELRASETAGNTPGLYELSVAFFRIVGCVLVCSLPAVIYFLLFRRLDLGFWLLYAGGMFFFPMGLLAVVVFDSIRALNPILVVASIFSTFFQYMGLVLFYYVLTLLNPLLVYLAPHNWLLGHLVKLVSYYLALVTAHLLGRFYFRYQEKLNWEV